VHALINQGSEISLTSEALVQRLHYPRLSAKVLIIGIRAAQPNAARDKINLILKSRVIGALLTAVAFILPSLFIRRLFEPQAQKTTLLGHIFKSYRLLTRFYATDPIELLRGIEVCSNTIEDGLHKGRLQTPIAQKTL